MLEEMKKRVVSNIDSDSIRAHFKTELILRLVLFIFSGLHICIFVVYAS